MILLWEMTFTDDVLQVAQARMTGGPRGMRRGHGDNASLGVVSGVQHCQVFRPLSWV